VVDKFGVPDGI